jgi:biopolymer transport protein ExbB/TolQ
MWTCLNCSNENSLAASFCVYCGAPRAIEVQAEDDLRTAFKQARHGSLTTGASFAVDVPAVLRISESAIKATAAMLGIAIGIGCSVLLFLVADPNGMTGRLFNLKDPFGTVPLSILVAFFWGLSICAMRYLRIRAKTRLSRETLLRDAIEVARLDGPEQLAKDLEIPNITYSPLLRRIKFVASHWTESPGLQDADLLLQQEQYFDEENVRGGYSLVRTFIWALPVLGLLGTVAGVAVAVGGFAEFLSGNIEDVAVIKRSLVNVTAGLSYAFLTTLYGLACALVLMLLTTALQGREERLHTVVHQQLVNSLLPLLQRIAPERKSENPVSLAGFQEQLIRITDEVLKHVREQAKVSLESFAQERSTIQQNIVHWGKLIREEASAGAQNLAHAIDLVGIKMSNANLDFLERLQATKAEIDQQATSVLRSTAELSESVLARQEKLLECVSSQNELIQKNAEVLTVLLKTSGDVVQVNRSLNDSLTKVADLKLDRRADEILKAMDLHRQEIAASMLALTRSSEVTSAVLSAQASLNDSVAKLHDIQLENTLREFRDSLVGLKPALENLREPFILQAVPIPKNATS